MKYLVLIPTLLLFLSNIPFIQEMKMEMPVAEKMEKECCKKKSADGMESCHKPEPKKSQKKECCNKAETTCICISCFQFVAPAQFVTKLIPSISSVELTYNSFHTLVWKDPFVSIPWQPPDAFLV